MANFAFEHTFKQVIISSRITNVEIDLSNPNAILSLPIGRTKNKQISRARPMLGIENFRVYDLRRTVATSMASLGVNPHTISLVLDHISVTKGTVPGAVYVKYSFDREKRQALELWADYLQGIVFGKEQANSLN